MSLEKTGASRSRMWHKVTAGKWKTNRRWLKWLLINDYDADNSMTNTRKKRVIWQGEADRESGRAKTGWKINLNQHLNTHICICVCEFKRKGDRFAKQMGIHFGRTKFCQQQTGERRREGEKISLTGLNMFVNTFKHTYIHTCSYM